jgi:hypothetical protein
MRDQNHAILSLLQGVDPGNKMPFCPDNQHIAEYFDNEVGESDKKQLERHFVDCRYCRARIGIMERSENTHADVRIPETLLAKAKQLSTGPGRRRGRRVPAWAAAAVLVLGVFAVFEISRNPSSDVSELSPDHWSSPATERKLRSTESAANVLQVYNPLPRARVSPGSIVEWEEVTGRLYYDLSVVTSEGDVLTTLRTSSTQWTLDQTLPLEQGSTYYLRVAAMLPDGRSVNSPYVQFDIDEQN